MKTKLLKRVTAVLIVLSVCYSAILPVNAEESRKVYVQLFEEMMKRIESDYAGPVDRRQLFESAMKGMFQSLDEYSEFFDREQTQRFEQGINRNFQGIGIVFQKERDQYVVIKLLTGGSAEEGGVQVGDVLLSADNTALKDLSTEEVVSKITGEKGSYVDLVVGRGQKQHRFRLQRRDLQLPTAEQFVVKDLATLLPNGIREEDLLFVRLSSFGTETAKELKAIMEKPENKKAKLLVLDLRNNGGGYVNAVLEIANMLIPKGKVVTFKDSRGHNESYYSILNQPPYRKIIALVNKNSASASEILAGALKDSGMGVLIGERTYGKGLAQEVLRLHDGEYSFKLTYREFFTPAGHPVQKVGIYPHILEETPRYMFSEHRFFVGDQSEAVYDAENILRYLGYFTETPDNQFGTGTVTAMRKFQKDYGLSEGNVLDFTTQAALNTALRRVLTVEDRVVARAIRESAKILLTDGK